MKKSYQKTAQAKQFPKAKKALGQHFLTNESVIEHLLQFIQPQPDDVFIEVGPGPGVLTQALAAHCDKLHTIELDQDMIQYCKTHLSHTLNNITFTHGDILKTPLLNILDNQNAEHPTPEKPHPLKYRIASNLPYQISSPFLFSMAEQRDFIQDITLLLQNEVVKRIAAAPGSKTYGRLSVMMQFYFETIEGIFVPPEAFTPPPAVDSATIQLIPKQISAEDLSLAPTLEKVVKLAFGQRRKTLSNTLKPIISTTELQTLEIDPRLRAETLSLEAFLRISKFHHASLSI